MSVCCSRFVDSCLARIGFLDEKEPDITQEELKRRIENEQKSWLEHKRNRKEFWDSVIQRINPDPDPSCFYSLNQALKNFQIEGAASKRAVDLGCGIASSLYLLERGWDVVAVDSSKGVLRQLKKKAQEISSSEMGTLKCVHSSMEKFKFPKNVQLVLARDSLPYCNPEKIQKVWKRAYESLAPGGRIVGNFFPLPCNIRLEALQREVFGSWHTDIACVKALLDFQGYTIELCQTNKKRYEELFFGTPRQIDFVGLKD